MLVLWHRNIRGRGFSIFS